MRKKRFDSYPFLKRFLDLLFSSSALLALSPLFLIVGIAIKLDSPGGVFYRGVRVGRCGRAFRIFKFRTMVADAEKRGSSSTPADDLRVTRIGKFLRRYKVDELPQLLNVFLGQMSLVGPRPQVLWAVQLYNEKEKALLSVLPGITDYASIRFRNEAEILSGSAAPDQDYLEKIAPEKTRLGLAYVRNRSLATDLTILAATLWTLAGGEADWVFPVLEGVSQSFKEGSS